MHFVFLICDWTNRFEIYICTKWFNSCPKSLSIKYQAYILEPSSEVFINQNYQVNKPLSTTVYD